MSTTLEEKILDGPRIHYCDVDGDEDRPEDEDSSNNDVEEESTERTGPQVEKGDIADLFRPITEEDEKLERLQQVKWVPSSSKTGPKGVIGDYMKRRNKEMKSKAGNTNAQKNLSEEDRLDLEFEALLNDESLIEEFISKRISRAQQAQIKIFGQLYRLDTGEQLLKAIDDESPDVTVLVHIYTKTSKSCSLLNKSLERLADEFKDIKFVTLDACATSLSQNFKKNGVPALLAYRGGDLFKSIVQFDELLDQDFGPEEVKDILLDNGLV